MEKIKRVILIVVCTIFGVCSYAQQPQELSKFKTYHSIKDTVSSFAPLQTIIDYGFTYLSKYPTSSENGAVIATLVSNTESGPTNMRDDNKFGYDWAKYVRTELDKNLADQSLTIEAKALFSLMKAASNLNCLPPLEKVTSEQLNDVRKQYDIVYDIYPSLPNMIEFEIKYENFVDEIVSHEQKLKHRIMLSTSKNEKVSAYYTKVVKEMTEPFELKFTAFDGTEVDIAKMKGKVILIDFWATWCGPCVAEIPHVKEVYKKYHDKGFEVIGISLDQDKKRLQTYLKKNKIPWVQYFDGKGWRNELAVKHGIDRLPTAYLLNRDGSIYTKDGRDVELDKAMKELFK